MTRRFALWILSISFLFSPTALFAQDSATFQRALMKRARPAVVGITCRATNNGRYFGTGTVIHPDGYILTSTLVIPQGARSIEISLFDGKRHEAKVVKSVEAHEVVILKINVKNHAFLAMGDSSKVKLGDAAYTVGNAFSVTEQEGQVALCAGIVSGIYDLKKNDDKQSKFVGNVIETTAAINGGVDGGPLLNERAEVIGLISLAHSKQRFLGCAIPINQIRADFEGGNLAGGRLGMSATKTRKGALRLDSIIAGGSADKAGLKIGDRITKVNGQKLADLSEWLKKVDVLAEGTEIKVDVRRGPWGKDVTVKVGAIAKSLEISWPNAEPFTAPKLTGALARVYRSAVNKVQKSVVTINVTRGNSSKFVQNGSGVITESNGYILTSHYNINRAGKIKVTLSDGRDFAAKVIGTAQSMDLALIKIEAENLPVPTFGKPIDVAPGTLCGVVGRGLGSKTLTTGVISALGRQKGACYQLDAIMNLANTGGAIINTKGEVIGIGCFIGNNRQWRWGISSGVGFAVTMNKISKVMGALKKGRAENTTPILGVTSAQGTLKIETVGKGTAAEKGGLKPGDKVITVNGKRMKGWGDLVNIIRTSLRGDKLQLVVDRAGKRVELTITL
jgi:S1-C subfamily serine protease